jgi:hypothetical protein
MSFPFKDTCFFFGEKVILQASEVICQSGSSGFTDGAGSEKAFPGSEVGGGVSFAFARGIG